MRKYENLGDLLQQNPAAKKFFDSLPDYVRESIEERGNNIRYDRDLRGYAEKLLRGDDYDDVWEGIPGLGRYAAE